MKKMQIQKRFNPKRITSRSQFQRLWNSHIQTNLDYEKFTKETWMFLLENFPDYIDTWFNSNYFHWNSLSHYLVIYANKYFEIWWNPIRFNWKNYNILEKFCDQYKSLWDPKKQILSKNNYDLLLEYYKYKVKQWFPSEDIIKRLYESDFDDNQCEKYTIANIFYKTFSYFPFKFILKVGKYLIKYMEDRFISHKTNFLEQVKKIYGFDKVKLLWESFSLDTRRYILNFSDIEDLIRIFSFELILTFIKKGEFTDISLSNVEILFKQYKTKFNKWWPIISKHTNELEIDLFVCYAPEYVNEWLPHFIERYKISKSDFENIFSRTSIIQNLDPVVFQDIVFDNIDADFIISFLMDKLDLFENFRKQDIIYHFIRNHITRSKKYSKFLINITSEEFYRLKHILEANFVTSLIA